MRKVIAAFNMTLDGFCDHTSTIADDEILLHYANLLSNAGTILYGRITYQLMEYWQLMVKEPTGNEAMDKFAVIIDDIKKIVFSHTLKNIDWESATLANGDFKEEVLKLKQNTGKDILIGSRSLILTALKLNLIDQFQLCVHPVIAGSGLPLFENIDSRINLKLIRTKTFDCGAVILYYEPIKNNC